MGSSFFFNYRTQKDAPPHSLIPKISQDLASAYPAWQSALNTIVARNRSVRFETSISQQFDSLLLQPSLAVYIPFSILFVIDGLDEAGENDPPADINKNDLTANNQATGIQGRQGYKGNLRNHRGGSSDSYSDAKEGNGNHTCG